MGWMEFAIGPLDQGWTTSSCCLTVTRHIFISKQICSHSRNWDSSRHAKIFLKIVVQSGRCDCQVSHYRQYPPGTQYAPDLGHFSCLVFWCFASLCEGLTVWPLMAKVYSYFESRGCDREGWHEICFFGWELGRLFGGCLLVERVSVEKCKAQFLLVPVFGTPWCWSDIPRLAILLETLSEWTSCVDLGWLLHQ